MDTGWFLQQQIDSLLVSQVAGVSLMFSQLLTHSQCQISIKAVVASLCDTMGSAVSVLHETCWRERRRNLPAQYRMMAQVCMHCCLFRWEMVIFKCNKCKLCFLKVKAVKLFFTPEDTDDPVNNAKRYFLQTGKAT